MTSRLALIIGNSRWHWAWFVDSDLKQAWDTPHLSPQAVAILTSRTSEFRASEFKASHESLWAIAPDLWPLFAAQPPLPLWLAGVVPAQMELWQAYPCIHRVTLAQIPLQQLYATLGIDRALALWGAAQTLGLPALVIDAGTALTLTAANGQGELVGGAILPGVALQMRALAHHTAGLPLIDPPLHSPTPFPLERWACNTPDAIRSGVLYGLLAAVQDYIQAWQTQYPTGAIALTGGDSLLLLNGLHHSDPTLACPLIHSPHLSLWGLEAIAQNYSPALPSA